MKTIKTIASILALACITFTSCEDEPTTDESKSDLKSIELTDGELIVSKQNSQFAWNMFDCVNAQEGNTIVSPLSASFAMCMTANGANGKTRDEIYRAFGFENCNNDDVNSYMQKLSNKLMYLDSKTTVAIANSLWYNKSYNIYDSYIATLKTNYNAEVKLLGTNAVDDINNWCSKNTKGYIKNLLNPGDISELTVSVLVNALYFHGEWKDKFDKAKTSKGFFFTADNDISEIDFMNGQKEIEQVKTETFTMASLDFGNSAFVARFILPNTDKSFSDCISEIKSIGWAEITKNHIKGECSLKIPKFTINNRLDMTPIYQQMSIESAFNYGADFSNMSSNYIAITNAFQSNYFEINEDGAKAASASNTTGDLMAMGDLTPVILNHPFIFALTERSTGAILFIGKIEKL